MLNPLTAWTPGTLVRYHDSLTDLHGVYQAHPCDCRRCDDPALGTARFQLTDANGTIIAACVHAHSITAETRAGQPTPSNPAEPLTVERYIKIHGIGTTAELEAARQSHEGRRTAGEPKET